MAEILRIFQPFGGKKGQPYRATIRWARGTLNVDLGTTDAGKAKALAAEELARVRAMEVPAGAPAPEPAPAAPAAPASSPAAVAPSSGPPAPAPGRVAAAFARHTPATNTATLALAVAAAAPAAGAPTTVGDIAYDPAEQRELAKMLGKVAHAANVGIVAWSVRMLGRKPDPPSDEEERVLEKAWTMQVQRWSRGRELSPVLVIGFASVGMGIGMYSDGEPIPVEREPATVLKLHEGGDEKKTDPKS